MKLDPVLLAEKKVHLHSGSGRGRVAQVMTLTLRATTPRAVDKLIEEFLLD